MTTIYKFKAGFTKLGKAYSPNPLPTITIDNGASILVSGTSVLSAPIVGEFRYSYTGTSGLDLVSEFYTLDSSVDSQSLFSVPDLVTYLLPQGSGSIDWSNNFIVTVSGLPRDGVYCKFTTDSAGVNLVASGYTNSFGKLDSLMLDAGTYFVWLQQTGVDFTPLPRTEVVV